MPNRLAIAATLSMPVRRAASKKNTSQLFFSPPCTSSEPWPYLLQQWNRVSPTSR